MNPSSGTQSKLFARTVEMRTTNVAKNIADIALRDGVNPASIDFDIVRVKSFVKEAGDNEYSPFTKEHLAMMRNPEYLLNPDLMILQEYVVKFKPIEPSPFKLKIQLASDKNRSVASATIKAGSIIKPMKDLKQQLYMYFNKIKLKNNMLIYLMDEPLKLAISKLSEMASATEPTKEDLTLLLAVWPQVEETVNDRIIYHYKEKNRQDEDARQINHADRGFISAVVAGEVLVEYVEPKFGKAGRGFNGKYISVPEPVVDNYPDFGVDNETIEIVSEDGKKLYKALSDGYVKLENGVLSIDKTMAVGGISLKSTGNIRAGVDKNVVIEVDGKDPSEEVIGADMVVEASVVRANGSVAGGAKIKAESITVTGQTHQTSELYAKNIDVNILRGVAVGERVKIRTLENGRVKGEHIEIEQAVGGDINGHSVVIGNTRGRTKVAATKSIVIKDMTKGENRFSIDPMADDEYAKEINTIDEEVAEVRKQIEAIKRSMEQNTSYILKNQESFKQIQQKIMDDKKEGRPPSPAFVRMAKEFLDAQKKHEEFNAQIESLEKEIADRKEAAKQYDQMVLDAKVENEAVRWVGYNEIKFVLPVFGKEFSIGINDGDRIARLRLVLNKMGEYEVSVVHA